MDRIGFRFVIGLVVLCIGASLAVDLVFDIHLPLVRAALAVLLLAFGARMIMHGRSTGEHLAPTGEAWLADQRFTPEGTLDRDARYDIAFGRGIVDLTHLTAPATDVTVTVHALFGAAVIKVDPAIGYDVEGSAALGEVRMPDRSSTAMGSLTYRPHHEQAPRLHVRVNAVFGACQVVEAPHAA